MIVATHKDLGLATCRTLYEVKCDKCGSTHNNPAIMPDTSAYNAAMSGWSVTHPYPGESLLEIPVKCPKCKR